uniref:Uncharacterized protein n=1 Tax=Setaria viridis TaxID=4556 RepID=A0A4U6VEG9_SETVI|nr:hypothetical protein SEVIR_3G227901v2 [Setaria viridis]
MASETRAMVHPGGCTAARLMELSCRRPPWCRSRLLVGGRRRPRCSRPTRGRPLSTLPHVPAGRRGRPRFSRHAHRCRSRFRSNPPRFARSAPPAAVLVRGPTVRTLPAREQRV